MKRDASWHDDVEIAEQLCYPRRVVELLKQEKDPEARQRILHDARKGVYDE